jgi:hypothetical protein
VIARPAPPGKVVDASVPVPASTSAKLAAQGVVGIIRTLAYKAGASEASDLHADELAWHLANGLWVSAYQRVRNPGWYPKLCDGHEDAQAAATEARAIGLPAGMHLWEDSEGRAGVAADGIRYDQDWAAGMTQMAYGAAYYVGYDTLLKPEQLYTLPHDRYGSDIGHRRVTTCGVCWSQQPSFVLDGITFDAGEMQSDLLGRLPIVCSS